ncbi:DHH family phosphoesterase [Niallia endozanthoxylica]|uniref:Oligoribonuclease n=1 Tax=Niallia endozanthoxylica TaxID=2036016 RepID=A0A5J5HU81_9BACI|nr:oligoribonuclease [Niallia endozanthoxylica]KAA9025741.1 oligoribonuclease [Niallia endozanthoxylica]
MIHLYTHNDLDGLGCGILAKIAFGEEVEVHYNSVARINSQVERFFELTKSNQVNENTIWITDLSVNEANSKRIEQFVQEGGKAQFIDHHKTALHLNEYSWAKVTVEYDDGRLTSATSLFYDYLLENKWVTAKSSIDEFVELIRQYDTWEWEKNNEIKAKQLNDLFSLLSLDEFEGKMLERLKSENTFSFNEFEQQLLKMEEEKINRYIRKKNRELVQTFVDDHCVGIVHAEMYHSELGNELGKENSHLDYIVILNMGGKKVSFRTIHDHVDVSAVAGKFGGGGHVKASGCTMNETAYKLFVHEVFPLDSSRLDAPKNQHNLKNNPEGSLYENNNREKWFIREHNNQWIVENGSKTLPLSFNSFTEAEHFVKRQYNAALSRDDQYAEYIKNSKKG